MLFRKKQKCHRGSAVCEKTVCLSRKTGGGGVIVQWKNLGEDMGRKTVLWLEASRLR